MCVNMQCFGIGVHGYVALRVAPYTTRGKINFKKNTRVGRAFVRSFFDRVLCVCGRVLASISWRPGLDDVRTMGLGFDPIRVRVFVCTAHTYIHMQTLAPVQCADSDASRGFENIDVTTTASCISRRSQSNIYYTCRCILQNETAGYLLLKLDAADFIHSVDAVLLWFVCDFSDFGHLCCLYGR